MDGRELQNPVKVFISHSSQDLAFVQPLIELFRHIGLNEECFVLQFLNTMFP